MTLDQGRAAQSRAAQALDGRYQLAELLGVGGVARVYRARDLVLERDVAVKVYGPGVDANAPERERAEMRTLASLSHPNLVTLHDAGTDYLHTPPRAFLVMALIDGQSLAQRLQSQRPDGDELRGIATDVSAALAYVHSRDLVHRDVKPGNILLDRAGTAYLADFGVAQTVGASGLTATGDTIGTAAFLSPEQVRGQTVTPATDIYALGLVLLEALTGQREYDGTNAETALARLSRPPAITGRVPDGWAPLLTAMTLSDPALRPSAREVVALLEHELPAVREPLTALDPTRVLTTPVPVALPATPAPASHATSTRLWPRPALLLAAGALAVLLLVILVGALGSGSPDSGKPVPAPPAGSPGPARLGPDLDRLQQLVTP